jgi:hypothetical protein
MMKNTLFVSFIVLMLAGCSDPKIDTPSDEAMKASIEKVRASLAEDKRAEFDKALQLLALSQISISTLLAEGATGVGSTKAKMQDAISGKTGNEIIVEARRIEVEQKARERVQALTEIKELEEKKDRSAAARAELAKFEVLKSRFYKEEQGFGGYQPIIELTVRNGTSHAISRAYFVGTLSSHGRSVPWLEEDFNYEISGGVEPGEKVSWRLSPNTFSKWGSINAPSDAVFTVKVDRLDGPDKKTLLSARDFTDHDAERLEMLKKKYEVAG